MRRNPWPAIVVALALLVLLTVGCLAVRQFTVRDTTTEEAVEETITEEAPMQSADVLAEAESAESALQDAKYTQFSVSDITVLPKKWAINAFDEIENMYFTYNNTNKVSYGSPTSWSCNILTSNVADIQIKHFADADSDEVLRNYSMTVQLFGTSTEAIVYEYVDEIDIVASYDNAAVVTVQCFTTDIDVARTSFSEAMDVTVTRK